MLQLRLSSGGEASNAHSATAPTASFVHFPPANAALKGEGYTDVKVILRPVLYRPDKHPDRQRGVLKELAGIVKHN